MCFCLPSTDKVHLKDSKTRCHQHHYFFIFKDSTALFNPEWRTVRVHISAGLNQFSSSLLSRFKSAVSIDPSKQHLPSVIPCLRRQVSPGNIHQRANCCHLACVQLIRVIKDQQAKFLSLNLTYVFWGSDWSSYLGECPTVVNKRLAWAKISASAKINIHTTGSKPTVCLTLKGKLEHFQFPEVMEWLIWNIMIKSNKVQWSTEQHQHLQTQTHSLLQWLKVMHFLSYSLWGWMLSQACRQEGVSTKRERLITRFPVSFIKSLNTPLRM